LKPTIDSGKKSGHHSSARNFVSFRGRGGAMATDDERLVPVFMPALGPLLIHAEDLKGEPLSHDEVLRIRDEAVCIMMKAEDASQLAESRGYRDIDPENCWFDWQHLRRESGRKPDLDPGPRINFIRASDPAYQQTIRDAHATLARFRAMLPADGLPRPEAMVKTEIRQGENKAFMWLSNTRRSAAGFIAAFFEISPEFTNFRVGDEFEIPEATLLDWMVNDSGVLHGGFSIRYYRSTLPDDEREKYDDYIGVTKYA
jgi:uncharacterized protein YegJ (DUF2314 family)